MLTLIPRPGRRGKSARLITEAHEERTARLAARRQGPHTARQMGALERGYAEAKSTLPYDADTTAVFGRPCDPEPGGTPRP
ncbi:hypothetical protein [Streptomyces sp. e14]|uniref:hypothetical protein n=1 Tax=Streptomyces sp. e14 TaxID=645465 RepID=UPI0012E28FE6|nr:hypothetical protein [Streptomyces sp. e14]